MTGNTQGDTHDAGMLVYSNEDGDGDMVCTGMEMSMPPNTWEPVRSSNQRGDSVGVERPGRLVHSLQESTVVLGDFRPLGDSVEKQSTSVEAHFFPDSAKLKQHSQCKE